VSLEKQHPRARATRTATAFPTWICIDYKKKTYVDSATASVLLCCYFLKV
jgi:hypothetical protein